MTPPTGQGTQQSWPIQFCPSQHVGPARSPGISDQPAVDLRHDARLGRSDGLHQHGSTAVFANAGPWGPGSTLNTGCLHRTYVRMPEHLCQPDPNSFNSELFKACWPFQVTPVSCIHGGIVRVKLWGYVGGFVCCQLCRYLCNLLLPFAESTSSLFTLNWSLVGIIKMVGTSKAPYSLGQTAISLLASCPLTGKTACMLMRIEVAFHVN